MSISAARAGTLTVGSLEGGSVIGFKDGQAGVKQLTSGHDDDVEALGDFVATKNLSNQSFRSVSLDRAPELPCGGDAEPPDRPLVWQDEQRAVAALNPGASLVHLLKFCAAANPFGRAKPGHWETSPAPTRWRPSVACGLSRAGV
jgi:hypothetical protein